MEELFTNGIELGRKHYAQIKSMSPRWVHRNVPVFIREHLFVPYYITEVGNEKRLYIIQFPLANDKVSFILFAKGEVPISPT